MWKKYTNEIALCRKQFPNSLSIREYFCFKFYVKIITNEENTRLVLSYFEVHLHVSIQQIANKFNMPVKSVYVIFITNKHHSFKILVQQLRNTDKPR